MELARRVAASDVGDETLVALEMAVDELASAYALTPPPDLLSRIRRHLGYVSALMDVRMTLAERRRRTVIGGWLSLLAATCDIDLGENLVAAVRLRTAAQLAEHADHPEILAWTLETRAWQQLTDGNPREAVRLARGAQEVAPRTSSAFIQATAQEGRAWARLGGFRRRATPSRGWIGSWSPLHSPTGRSTTTGTTRPSARRTRRPRSHGWGTRRPNHTRGNPGTVGASLRPGAAPPGGVRAARPGARSARGGSARAGRALRVGGGAERLTGALALLACDAGNHGRGCARRTGSRRTARGVP